MKIDYEKYFKWVASHLESYQLGPSFCTIKYMNDDGVEFETTVESYIEDGESDDYTLRKAIDAAIKQQEQLDNSATDR